MRLLGLPLALLLSGCPSGRPPPPRPPDTPVETGGGAGDDREPLAPDDPDAPDEPDEPGDGERPAGESSPPLSQPRAGSDLADTLPPPAGRVVPGGCEGGTRRPGESWRVDCNTCRCGDGGQSTCTAMACSPKPAL
jgi:Pacifastin inhibitor (LCMII)